MMAMLDRYAAGGVANAFATACPIANAKPKTMIASRMGNQVPLHSRKPTSVAAAVKRPMTTSRFIADCARAALSLASRFAMRASTAAFDTSTLMVPPAIAGVENGVA